MPGYILNTASTVMCTHGGTVTLTTANTDVKVDGSPALLESDIHTVSGCVFTLPGPKPSPCVTVEWSGGAMMNKAGGTKVLVKSSIGECKSAEQSTQGVATIANTQMKVKAK